MFPPKESYSTVMRFFDKPIANIQLHFRIDHALTDKGTETFSDFKALVDGTRLEATSPRPTQKRFLPKSDYTVTTFLISPLDGGFENNEILLGSHPLGFYEIWANQSSYDAFKGSMRDHTTLSIRATPPGLGCTIEQNSNMVKLRTSMGRFPCPLTGRPWNLR